MSGLLESSKPLSNLRKTYFDVARGICMICIVLGHTSSLLLIKFVFTFHLPVFFLISGYFFRAEEPIKSLVIKRIRTLIIPYFFSCACVLISYYCTRTYWLHYNPNDVMLWMKRTVKATFLGAGDTWEKPFDIPGIGAIWFLWATFWGSIILHFILKLSTIKRTLVIVGLFFFAKWSLYNIAFVPFSIQPGCTAVFFMYIGYLWRNYEESIKNIPLSIKALSVVVASILWLEFIKRFTCFWLVHCNYGEGFYDVIASLSGSFLILAISYFLDKKSNFLLKHIRRIGQYSVIALCGHIIELNTFPWWKIVEVFLGSEASELQVFYFEIVL